MKMKHLLSTVAIMAAITTGAIVTTQTVQAESPRVSEKKAETTNLPEIKKAYFEHYNVLRLELESPYVSNNSVLYLMHGEYMMLGTPIEKNGKTIAFDINTDSFAKQFPDQDGRKNVLNSLHLMHISFEPGSYPEKISIQNDFISSTLMNANDEGKLIEMGKVSTITNIVKLEGYQKFITQDAYADNTLNKKATTKTGGIGFKFNTKYKDEYTFSLTDQSGAVSGKVQYHNDDLFVHPKTNTFLSKEYTISATSKVTKETIEIAKFTPFNLF